MCSQGAWQQRWRVGNNRCTSIREHAAARCLIPPQWPNPTHLWALMQVLRGRCCLLQLYPPQKKPQQRKPNQYQTSGWRLVAVISTSILPHECARLPYCCCHTTADTLQCNSPFCKFEVTVKPTVKPILKLHGQMRCG